MTLLFDGGCPLCQREISFISSRDKLNNISFVDIDAPDYDSGLYCGISYREAMGRIHGITDKGDIVKDVQAFREAYSLVGLGWFYAPTSWPLLRPLFDKFYEIWSHWRFNVTGRPSLDQLCKDRELTINK
ncbi:thiol-disulfide oxidoreductase DCC family protein [Prochlorococcus marinus]|uniref:thiol-disulfide oxidoreductase DCC family protein n=1 Tax=Prochlorococcus marinus TaxID=1219 RepID=UPI001F4C9FCD|nr:DUF393 domain-containing protein [Prochlorococcus marinus]